MFGLMKKSTSEKLLASVYEAHTTILEKQKAYYEERLQQEYCRALTDLKAQLRELLVDTNYELVYSHDSLLRGKINAFMAHALAMFHEKAANRHE